MMDAEEFKARKAPYAPVSALEEFLERMGNFSVPARVDRNFLQKMSLARGNEWALLSALKFLGIINPQGVPTPAYRRLLGADRSDVLRGLVSQAYAPLLDNGGLSMPPDELVAYFRTASSPSQAKNAARFFRAVAEMAGLEGQSERETAERRSPQPATHPLAQPAPSSLPPDVAARLALARAQLLDKLPSPRTDWSAEQHAAIYDQFLEMLRLLEI
ncbi:MAG TPA: DUF5343 domain-containing protein [Chloroflexota bacterium]|nr:DUF5343 domain-containing protein [Chloroflexota bacterium]